MNAFNHVKNEIERHKQLLDDWKVQEAWYRNSTAGRRQKALYEYTIEVLESIRDNCDEGQTPSISSLNGLIAGNQNESEYEG